MMINNIFNKSILLLISIIVITSFLILKIPGLLTLQKQIGSRVLVLEGWIPEEGLRMSYDLFVNENYDYIFVTGHQLSPEVTLYINSFLIIHHPVEAKDDSLFGLHTIKIQAESTIGRNDSAHFVLWLNDDKIADVFTSNSRNGFEVSWEGSLNTIDSIMIQFDNDKVSDKGDRNLRISSVLINENEMIGSSLARFIDRGRPFGQSRWNITADNFAALAANYFTGRGIEPNRVISVPNYSAKRRTYGNAVALSEWFMDNNMQIESINIVSTHYHSRRTWLIYNHLLKDRMQVGIISLDVSHSEKKTLAGQFKTIVRELMALLYYCIFIMPWI